MSGGVYLQLLSTDQTVPTAHSASPFACGNSTTCHVIKSILSPSRVYCLWNAVSTQHFLQWRYDCVRGRYFKLSNLNVLWKNSQRQEDMCWCAAMVFLVWASTTRAHFMHSLVEHKHYIILSAGMSGWHAWTPDQPTSSPPSFKNQLLVLVKNLQHLLPQRAGYGNYQNEASSYWKNSLTFASMATALLTGEYSLATLTDSTVIFSHRLSQPFVHQLFVCLVSVAGKICTTESTNTIRSASSSIFYFRVCS